MLLLDRADFPRDKPCGDGIAPHVLDVLEGLGVGGLLDDWAPVRRLRLRDSRVEASRSMQRPAYVVPRRVLDARLVERAVGAGAVLRRCRVRTVRVGPEAVFVDDAVRAKVVVGADGAHSVVRSAVGAAQVRRRALALRGYAPVRPELAGEQLIVFGQTRQPSYAWSFDRGDGFANVGYGELLAGDGSGRAGGAPTAHQPVPSRELLLGQLDTLIPGAGREGDSWRAHHLPLSSWRFQQPDGPVLLVGDAAGLINPLTGEGIYYAVATGALAGRIAVQHGDLDGEDGRHGGRLGSGPADAGGAYRREVRTLLGRHLRHTAAVARLARVPHVLGSGIRAAHEHAAVFDDLVEIGLGQGLVSRRTALAVGQELWRQRRAPPASAP